MAALLVRLLTAIRVGRLAATETTTAYVRRLLTACGSHGASPTDGAPSSDLSDLLSGAHLSALDLEPLSAPAAGSTSTSAGTQPGVAPLVTPLTEREVEVLHLLAVGAANADIARLLVLSIGTVKKHVYNICTKLNVRSRSQAVARARALRLL